MKTFKMTLLATSIAVLAGCNSSDDSDDNKVSIAPKDEASLAWYQNSAAEVTTAESVAQAIDNAKGSAKNIILFVGDGMGVSTVTAGRILEGQQQGMTGEENMLSFDDFPFSGLSKTYNTNQQTPDSAGTMTAMMSGVKSKAGVIGVSEDVVRADCVSSQGTELATALELAEIAGKSTGIVSTARITHATPAATYAKSPERNWEDDGDMPQAARDAGCLDIADQLIQFEDLLEARVNGGADSTYIDGIDVVMGGGRRSFLPNDASANSLDAVSTIEGDRTDGRNLITEWQTKYPTGSYIMDQAGFDTIDPTATTKVLGLFNESHMHYEADRANDGQGEPSLSEMTSKAIDVLDNNENGFFLMVESGRIDHGHHAGSAYNALTDTVEFANAVKAAVEGTDPEDTLIIVTADHSHVFTIAGYPTRGNPILGKVVTNDSNGEPLSEPALAADDMPYTTLAYTNGMGFHDLGNETDADAVYSEVIVSGRADISAVNTESTGFHQEALVPMSSETHAGEDVGIYAVGPGAQLITGTNEQNIIFHVMNHAGNLLEQAENRL
ncbi:alkaline phosphatase [Neptunomonas phycophila]|uniref:alkaline phosphatase n=1 Tax=Neptunomonas phycophila TaxID=1572645 RepID=UPI0037363908